MTRVEGEPEIMLDSFDRTLAGVDALIGAIAPNQLDDPTPCPGWNVRTVINHLIDVCLEFAAMAAGNPAPNHGIDHTTIDLIGDDHIAAFRDAARTTRAAFARPGMIEQVYQFPWGTETGANIVQHVIDELLIHGWDLARATGQPTDLPADLAETSLRNWQAWFAQWPRASGDNFGPEQPVPADASAADRLAAYLGRPL